MHTYIRYYAMDTLTMSLFSREFYKMENRLIDASTLI